MSVRKLDRKTRKILKTGWIIALLISAWALFSPWGAIRYYKLTNDLEHLDTRNLELQEINRKLSKEIAQLTDDPAYIENVAREQHGLLRSNEFVYKFTD